MEEPKIKIDLELEFILMDLFASLPQKTWERFIEKVESRRNPTFSFILNKLKEKQK